uniref:ADAM10 endopeptidase n=1 Tax=Crassostrea virginica TaxID=6565 RepID=A0A8B8C935_CRAVI|nr:disintegrin and metalloproteinase domain-containing protein 10-like [Crassostrea virginica]
MDSGIRGSCYHVIFTTFVLQLVSGLAIDHILHDYRPLFYDHHKLKQQHERMRRSTIDKMDFEFHTQYRHFKVRLKRDNHVFNPDVIIETSHGPVDIDTSFLYSGALEGEKSRVFGHINSEGHFQGQIQTKDVTYFMEPSSLYFKQPQDFHSIIYTSNDVIFNSTSFCNADGIRHSMMNSIPSMNNEQEINQWQHRYSFDANLPEHRRKRAIDPTKTVCSIYMQADHTFYQKYSSNIDTVVAQLGVYVQAVNNIFQRIDFDGDSSADNIGFLVKRLKVHTDPNASGYKLNGHYSVEKFLDLHSSDNYDGYCLSYMFTDRDFDGGVLGLAWVASLTKAGGICEAYRSYSGEYKSLNTGIVTVKNYGAAVASVVTQVTFAHEIGHNFGSEHDTDGSGCAPGGSDGNYIMYAHATSGYLPNNDKFSNCSINQVAPIIENKGRSSSGCFIAPVSHVCGNKIVESPHEQCDCGWDDECSETCCHAAGTPTECTYNNTGGLPLFCSPSEGPCCDTNCQRKTSGVCRGNTSCLAAAQCDGSGVSCPSSAPEPNGTACANGQVCFLGECSASVCLAKGYQSCQCPGSGWKDSDLCRLCCQVNDTCSFAGDIPDLTEANAFTGAPCNNFKGYCDVFHVCREVDPTGPLSNIRKLLLSGDIINKVKQFLTDKWWVAVLAAVGLFVLMGIFIKVCGKSHGPRDEKKGGKKGKKRSRDSVISLAGHPSMPRRIHPNEQPEDRDPNKLNQHVKVQFEDVLNEAPGLKTFDFVWLCSRECYGFFHGLCYGLITLFLAPFIALAWGCSFAFTAFEHIWCLTPIEKNVYICCGTCFKNCFKYMFDCFITPCTSACGGIFVVFHTDSPQTTVVRPKARQTKTASRDKKNEDEDVEPMDETKAFLAVPVVLRESSYVTNHKDNAMKSIQRQMNMFQ